MRIQLISDWHSEFYQDTWKADIDALDPDICDVLVLAGDIGSSQTAEETVARFCRHFAPKPVVFVKGNHEHYGSEIQEMSDVFDGLARIETNLVHLDNRVEVIDGQRFVGSTLWYPDPTHQRWSDYRHIHNSWKDISLAAQVSYSFLDANLREGDVVVTHMLPHEKCVVPRWQGNDSNQFFIHDCDTLIRTRRPALWCYGHGHDANDFTLADTRLAINPRGYPYEDSGFKDDLVLEV